jgi:hypothetical protein
MTDDIQELIRQKRELEQRIHLLMSGAIIRDKVKLDKIGFAGKYQKGKWALFYRYDHVVNRGRGELPQPRSRWTPMINGDSIEEVINQIPDAIKALTELYEIARGGEHGTDT